MSLRAHHLALCLAALAALGVSVAGAQPPPSASFTASNNEWTANGGGNTATIAVGGSVTFTSGPGNNPHNARFSASGPSICDPALPVNPTSPTWSSTCRFDAPGTYSFICTQHDGMDGTVEVVAAGTPTTPPPGAEPGTPPGGGSPGGSPSEPGTSSVKVPRRQRGTMVRGSVTTTEDGSRLAVRALVSNRALTEERPRRIRKVSVGSLRRQLADAGTVHFVIKLSAAARRALKRSERLAVELRIKVTPPTGDATTRTARVTVRPAA